MRLPPLPGTAVPQLLLLPQCAEVLSSTVKWGLPLRVPAVHVCSSLQSYVGGRLARIAA